MTIVASVGTLSTVRAPDGERLIYGTQRALEALLSLSQVDSHVERETALLGIIAHHYIVVTENELTMILMALAETD